MDFLGKYRADIGILNLFKWKKYDIYVLYYL